MNISSVLSLDITGNYRSNGKIAIKGDKVGETE